MINDPLAAKTLKEFIDDLIIDDVTNEEEPDGPTVWVTGNLSLSELNILRALAGLAKLEKEDLDR